MDPKMPSFSKKVWEEIVARFYQKYKGLAKWHTNIVETVKRHGTLRTPTGRLLTFSKSPTRYGPQYREPQIKNWPVQSFAMDVVSVAMTELLATRTERNWPARMCNQIHDAILWDSKPEVACEIADTMIDTFTKLPATLSKTYNINFDIPLTGDVKIGPDWLNMKEHEYGSNDYCN